MSEGRLRRPERLDGVRSVRVDLQTNVVTIAPAPGEEMDLEAIPRRVRESGFTPGEMRLAALGEVLHADGGSRFRIAAWRRSFPLAGALPRPAGVARIEATVVYEGETPVLTVHAADAGDGDPRQESAPGMPEGGVSVD